MTELDRINALVAPIEARASNATPEPWLQPLEDERRAIAAANRPRVNLLGIDVDGMAVFENAASRAFSAHARTDVPALIAELRVMAAKFDGLSDELAVER